jgi:flavin reductase (DIM6/NTAB) family NADH-FMN oxidoreductase RutF
VRDDGAVTISGEHPFLVPDAERSPVRRLRGRLPLPITLWTAGELPHAGGLTVASVIVADGDPGHVLGLIDPESGLWAAMSQTGLAVVAVLHGSDRRLSDAFGYVAPAPGGPFSLGRWEATPWGPRLAESRSWAGVRLRESREVGYGVLVETVVEHIELEPAADNPFVLYHGAYRSS